MTSEFFKTKADDGWEDWGEWGAENQNQIINNNNNLVPTSHHSPAVAGPVQQTHHQQHNFTQQQPATVAGTIYSPYSYHQTVPQNQQGSYSNPNPVNFFNPVQFSDNANNNQANFTAFNSPIQAPKNPVSQSAHPIPSSGIIGPPPAAPVSHNENVNSYRLGNKRPENIRSQPITSTNVRKSPSQFQQTPVSYTSAQQTAFMPPQSSSPLQLPPPPQTDITSDDLYTSNQQKNLPAPPAMQMYDPTNFNQQPMSSSFEYQQPQQQPTWQQPLAETNPFSAHQHPQEWHIPPSSIQQQQQQPQLYHQEVAHHEPFVQQSNARFYENTETVSSEQQTQDFARQMTAAVVTQTPISNQQYVHRQTIHFENTEIVTAVESPITSASIHHETPHEATTSSSNMETLYPENRERLDDISLPQAASFTDRHNYLVTGQLPQEHQTNAQQYHSIEQNVNINEDLPPPGLSRMVVGQPESNQEQFNTAGDNLPPRENRMVTGTEMSPSNYINFQRQADGEVSQIQHAPAVRPPSHSPFTAHQQQQQIIPEASQQNFNISDRNLYLMAGDGESESNNQRVIPGVESDINSISNAMTPMMQNLHIEDDDDFIHVTTTNQERNVNVDGMENVMEQRSIDTEPREEAIDGANDNNTEVANVPLVQAHENVAIGGIITLEPEPEIREEAIEGANDYNEPLAIVKQIIEDSEHKRSTLEKKQKPEIGMSSEDSELRERQMNVSKIKSKSRRNKNYDDSNDSESENEDGYKDRRDKYDDRYKRSSRERMTRDEYDRYRRKEKERRSGGGRTRRGDDTDGSRHGDNRRRPSDDEDDDVNREKKKVDKYRKSGRKHDDAEVEVADWKERKKDKYRESGSRRKDYYDDERRDRRRRDRYDYDENYSGRRSQNASDREYASDRYSRRSRDQTKFDATSYYQQYGTGAYDYNAYYQQQQYFETLRRTNPQAYAEWYRNYYSMMQQQMHPPATSTIADDVAGSLRSGYSSSNEKDRASTSRFLTGGNISRPLNSMNTSFIDNTDYGSLQAYPTIGKDLSQTYASLNLNQSYGYDAFSRKSGMTSAEAQRLTPKKFQSLHGFVRLSNGLMTTINLSGSDRGPNIKIENIPAFDKNRRLYQSFPGPLIRGVSHKKTIIEFCEEKLKQDQSIEGSNRASYALLWRYLILMLRQNGNYTEADISELLMKNSDDFKSILTLDSGSESHKNLTNDDNTDISDSEENHASEKNSASASREVSTMSTMSEKIVLHKFRDYLLYGNINDALDFATDNNLWGHALFLASKVNVRQHANVMLKFANKLPYNDPLQTLYQIMSGRMPACASNLDDKWGDWRPHLAMIISNCTDKPDLVKRSIMALGDSLSVRGDIYGSQFCYLLIDPQFTEYSDVTNQFGKISLLGTTNQRPFKEFACDDAIIMTEVYEYARSLSSENFFISSLQKYKFLLAANMMDHGLQLKCLLYMEQIAKCITQLPEAFDVPFITKVYSLADRLKFYDPVMEKAYEDNYNNNGFESIEDPKWLQDLLIVLQNYGANLLNNQEVHQQHQHTDDLYDHDMAHQPPSVPSTGIYDPISQHQTPTHVPSVPAVYEENGSYQLQQDPTQYNQVPLESYNQDQSVEQQQQQEPNYNYDYNNSMPPDAHSQMQQNGQQYQAPYEASVQSGYQQQPTYGYGWDQTYQQSQQPTITLGNAVSNKNDETATSAQQKNAKENDKSSATKPEPTKAVKKDAAQDAANKSGGGWFGGIFKWKAKNQMILPDDKNPAIVWDEKTKKWVNKDGDEPEAESFKPPPTMGQMIQGNSISLPPQQQQQQHQQQSLQQQMQIPQYSQPTVPQQTTQMEPAVAQNAASIQQTQTRPQLVNSIQAPENVAQPPAPAAPNMFKMQRGRNLKKSYVDILGNAGATKPAEAPAPMDMQFFNPVQQQQPQGMQFYNPNDFQ